MMGLFDMRVIQSMPSFLMKRFVSCVQGIARYTYSMQNAEFLESFAPGDERKAKLHELYEELENEYRSLINKLAAAMPAIQGGMSNVSFFQAKHF